MKKYLVFFIVITLLSACTTAWQMEGIERSNDKVTGLDVGDKVRITSNDGEVFEFKVKEITDHSIRGVHVEVELDQFAALSREIWIADKPTIWAVVTGVLLAIALLAYAFSDTPE